MKLLKILTQTDAPPGNESAVRELIINEIKDYVDEIQVDVLGNVIARKTGNGKKLMLCTHMDEVGIIAMSVDNNNHVHFSALGDVKPNALQYSTVKFLSAGFGVMAKSVENSEKMSDLYVDIFKCKGESLVGEPAVFVPNYTVFGDCIATKAMSSRIGCYILIETLKNISETNNDLYFVFTAQNNLGQRGAKVAAAAVMPDYAISVGCTEADDAKLKLGGGAAIKIMDGSVICHPFIKNLLKDCADAEKLSIQYEITEKEKTETGTIQAVGTGAIAGGLSVPLKYRNTAVETANILDIQDAAKILKRACTATL